MDPSKNNSFDSSDSGKKNPNSAGTPPNTGAVNPPVAGVTSQNAGSSAAVSSRPAVAPISNPAVAKPASSTGAFAPGAYRPMSARPMNPGMMPTAPIASGGTGDIVLSKDTGGNKSKKWWIIGGVVGALLLVILVVFAIINNGGFGGAKATDLRSAFNIYANYFLTGEAKDEDVPDLNGEVENDSDENIEEEDLEGDFIVEETMDGVDSEEEELVVESDTFFGKYIDMDAENEDSEYLEKIKEYFDTFYEYYIENMGEYEFAIDYVNEYKTSFDLLIAYYNSPLISNDELIEKYREGGEEAVNNYVSEATVAYEDLEDASFHDIILDYANAEIDLLLEYDKAGCLIDGEISDECTVETEEREILLAENYNSLNDMLQEAESEVMAGIYKLRSIVYDDASELLEDENYKGEDGDFEDVEE